MPGPGPMGMPHQPPPPGAADQQPTSPGALLPPPPPGSGPPPPPGMMQWQPMGPPPPQQQPQQQWAYLGQPMQPLAQFGQPLPAQQAPAPQQQGPQHGAAPQQAPQQQQRDSQHLQTMLQAAQQRFPQQQGASPPAPGPAEQQQQQAPSVWPAPPPPPPPRGSLDGQAPAAQQQQQAPAGRIDWADEEDGDEDAQSAEAWQSGEASYDSAVPHEHFAEPPEFVGEEEAYGEQGLYEEEAQYCGGNGQQLYEQPNTAAMYGAQPLPSQHSAFAEARGGAAPQHGYQQKQRKQQGWKPNKRAARKAAAPAAGYDEAPGQGLGEEDDYAEGSPVTQHQQRFKRQDRGRSFEPRGRQSGGNAAPAHKGGYKGRPPFQHYQHPHQGQGPRRGGPPGIPPRHLDDDYRAYPEEVQPARGAHQQGGRGAGAAGRGRAPRATSSSSASEGRGGLEVAVRMLAEEVQGGQ